MSAVPVVRVGGTLIATVLQDLRDEDALDFQEHVISLLERSNVHGVLLDLTALEMVDSFLGRLFVDVARGARLMGADTVVAGIQPAVAITFVELGLELEGIHTTLTAARGLALLDRLHRRANGVR